MCLKRASVRDDSFIRTLFARTSTENGKDIASREKMHGHIILVRKRD